MFKVCKEIPRAYPNPKEVLLNNRLDEEIQRILFPFNFFLTLFSCPKYSIRDNYITPNGNKILIFQLFGICFVTAITIDLLGLTNLATFLPSGNAFIIKLISIFLNLTRWFNFILNAILNIKNSLDNVCLIIMIQSIYKSVKVTGVFSFTVVNWIIVTIPIFIMVSASMSVAIIFSVIPNFFHNACTYILISYEIDFLYNTRILHLLCKYIDHWIKKIDLMTNDREDDEAYCLKLFETYQNILKAYEMYKKLYEVVILIRIMIAFCRNLCFFGYALQVIKQEQHDGKLSLPTLIMGALSMLGIVKDFVEVGFYCIICEKFYIALEEAEGACIRRIMNVNYTRAQEHLYLNVISENRKLNKVTACGLFCVDAALPLFFLKYFTDYAIVLLQFAYLWN